MLKITENIQGGAKAILELTDSEVQSGISVCENKGVSTVTVMKKHNGSALFFDNPLNAQACMERHDFEFSFEIKIGTLKEYSAGKRGSKGNDSKSN